MKLLGKYQSQLTSFYAEELLKLLETAVTLGEYGGSKLIDTTAAERLKAQSRDFATLPVIPAGSRATPESIDYPMSLLTARYEAISREREDFLVRVNTFLSVLEKDANLIDQLVAAANMERWVSRRPALANAVKFYQDFAASRGSAGVSLPLTDPATGVAYERKTADAAEMLNAVTGFASEPIRAGLRAPYTLNKIRPINMRWAYATNGVAEDLVTSEWAKLSLLEPEPRIQVGLPAVTVLAPERLSNRWTVLTRKAYTY